MQQDKHLSRGTIILAAIVAAVLMVVVFTFGSRTAQASAAQRSPFFFSYYQSPAGINANALDPEKTKEPKKDPGDKKITICHVPPGNPENAHTITISVNAWKTDGSGEGGHGPGLHGGDYVGPCRNAPASVTLTPTAVGGAANQPPAGSSVQQAWVPFTLAAPVCTDFLVYHTNQTGNWEIFRLGDIADRPGANANLSQGQGQGTNNLGPSLSPDRRWIAFASDRDGNWEVYVAATDGTSRQRVTYHSPATSTDPVWSPDGSTIVYESNFGGNWDLYAFNVQTGKEPRLLNDDKVRVNAFWSPDGQNLLFEQLDNGLSQIYQLNLPSLKSARLSDGTGNDRNPTYSADGQHIAFYSYRNGTNGVLYVMNADGSNATPVSDRAGSAMNQSWSPDSTLIAYQSKNGNDLGVYVYQLTTRQTRRVTNSQSANYAPTSSSNSTTLVFTSDVTGNPNLYATQALPMNAQPIQVNGQAQPLTNGQFASQYAEAAPREEDASTFGPQTGTVSLPQLGGASACGKAVAVPVPGSGPGFPVINTFDCGK